MSAWWLLVIVPAAIILGALWFALWLLDGRGKW